MIQLQQINKVYNKGQSNEVTAIKDLSLQINKGEFVVIIGSNGSGKTTLLNIIGGADTPSTGKILLNDVDVTSLPEYKRSKWIARVFQNPNNGTAPDLTILDNFRLAALRTQSKKIKIGINSRFKKLVQDKVATLGMGLENKVNQSMGSLSGGQRQALTLLMSVMDNTEILLLDEPTAALDPKSASVVMELADKLNSSFGITTLLITHSLKDAQQFGNRLIQMKEGNIKRDIGAIDKKNLPLTDIYKWFE
jgi:putative tryptophan/tyrosine transport system ATP-binding protein